MTLADYIDELDIQIVFDNVDKIYSESDARLIRERYEFCFTQLDTDTDGGPLYYDWFKSKNESEYLGDKLRVPRKDWVYGRECFEVS